MHKRAIVENLNLRLDVFYCHRIFLIYRPHCFSHVISTIFVGWAIGIYESWHYIFRLWHYIRHFLDKAGLQVWIIVSFWICVFFISLYCSLRLLFDSFILYFLYFTFLIYLSQLLLGFCQLFLDHRQFIFNCILQFFRTLVAGR